MSAANDLLINQNKVTGSGLSAANYMELVNTLNLITNFSNNQGLPLGQDAQTNVGAADGFNLDGQSHASGSEQIALGFQAKAYGWRACAIGMKAIAGSTSATALGTGTIARGVHHVALGRGAATSVEFNAGVVIGSFGMNDLYMGMSWGHYHNELPESGISQGFRSDPSTVENRFMGQDATDARDELWNSGVSYIAGKRITSGTHSYLSLIDNNLNNPLPSGVGVSNAQWRYLSTCTRGARADFNVDGGHSGMCVGRATGSGQSGEIRFWNARTAAGGGNSKQALSKAGFFDSGSIGSNESYFNLYITGVGERRLIVGAANSGSVAGRRALEILN